ncbi:MAG TPA: rhodanese-like domain-containing protein [Acidocella sp.]|nr:rhodanese-like domain-containing protein [Acidocella sp.]
MSFKLLSPLTLRAAWRAGQEIALFDLREEGPYSLAHPFWAVSLPLAQIELRIRALVPRLSAPIVVYDDGEGLTRRGAERIAVLGYANVAILEGGLTGYAAVGEVFRDVNVPSKAFGELVEAIRHTPSASAPEIKQLIESEEDLVVLDGRRFEEYRTMSIPRGRSVPNGELALRVHDIAPRPETTIVINCAGRTRSIIGTQTLVNLGLPNKVLALRNGTIGWSLAGQGLETGKTERFPETSSEGHEKALAAARRWADKVGVKRIGAETLAAWKAQAQTHTLYLLDVRTPEDYAAGHPAGFVSAPGGQLVQATDEWVAVRGGRLVLFDDDGVRALSTASWLVQLGWNAVALEPGAVAKDETGTPAAPEISAPPVPAITPAELHAKAGDYTIVDLGPSPLYRALHLPGAWFLAGSQLDDLAALPGEGALVITSRDSRLAAIHIHDIQKATSRPVLWLQGGNQGWVEAGLPACTAPLWASAPEDVYKRPYEGTDNQQAAMQAYIDWELQLVAQLANDGVSNFHVVR